MMRRFDFFRDSFSFRNELVWEYLVDEKTGAVKTRKAIPPPTYAHHCFVVVRAARQFLFHARFEPDLPKKPDGECRRLIREGIRRSHYLSGPQENRIPIPGFGGLRDFSTEPEVPLKG